jgi:hypothetical protein
MTRKSTKERSAREVSVIDELANLVHGITAPFTCSGTLVPDAPVTLRFKDGTELAVTRAESAFQQQAALAPLVARCSPAPFGHGRRTLRRRDVRDALHIKAEGGAFSVLHFDPAKSGVLDAIRRQLAPNDPNPLSAELYNVNVYGSDGHFQPHKDTPRGSDMIGTLVVCLPSQFSNGSFVVTHRGASRVHDWGEDIRRQTEPTRLHWAAFFGDVDHTIHKVWSGLRVTLTYILRRGEGAVPAPSPVGSQTELLHRRLSAALADRRFLPRGGVLAFPCFHMYSHEARFQRAIRPLTRASALKLKGRDQHVAAAAIQAGLTTSLQPYLVESCADQTWQLKRFPAPGARREMSDQVDPWELERVLPVAVAADDVKELGVTWVVPPPQFNFGAKEPEAMSETATESPAPDMPAIRFFHACEYSATGYFGNEGSDTEFYVYAALHVVVPPFGEGPRQMEKSTR